MKFVTSFIKNSRYYFLLIIFLLFLYTLLRGLFIWQNKELISVKHFNDIIKIFYSGLQQDFSAILLLNLPVFLLLFIYEYFRPYKLLLTATRVVFVASNAVGFALNIIDVGYFAFVKHRINLELVFIIKDSLSSYKSIVSQFWLLVIVFILIIIALVRISLLTTRIQCTKPLRPSIIVHQFIFICIILLLARGFRSRIATPYTPLLTVQAAHLPAAQNSFTTLVYSFLKKQNELQPYHFFSDTELKTIAPTSYYVGNPNYPLKKKNVVLFILESFSRGFLLPDHPYKAKTPFLDTLIQKSIFFPKAFANNYTSSQGIVSILGSIPTILDEPFYYSSYANLEIQGIGNALKKKGYNTNFLMGAEEDHFGFEKFSRLIGIDNYYSKKDFNDSRFEDGNWGIFDAPFFSYGVDVLNAKKQPFLAVFFNISSHFPFTLPEDMKGQFNDPQQLPSQKAISYVDYALKQFFEKSRNSAWFQNTIFVFCADHWFPYDLEKSQYSYVNSSAISFFIYDPSTQQGSIRNHVLSQVDIVPTILDLINYGDIYHGFGKSALDTSFPRFAVNKYQEYYYQCISDKYVLGVDPNSFKTEYLFRYEGDSIISQNLKNVDSLQALCQMKERYIKAYLQQYNKTLIHRKF